MVNVCGNARNARMLEMLRMLEKGIKRLRHSVYNAEDERMLLLV
jgi:hypothetical protein